MSTTRQASTTPTVIAPGRRVTIDSLSPRAMTGTVVASYTASYDHPRVGRIEGLFYAIVLDEEFQGYMEGRGVFIRVLTAHSSNVTEGAANRDLDHLCRTTGCLNLHLPSYRHCALHQSERFQKEDESR